MQTPEAKGETKANVFDFLKNLLNQVNEKPKLVIPSENQPSSASEPPANPPEIIPTKKIQEDLQEKEEKERRLRAEQRLQQEQVKREEEKMEELLQAKFIVDINLEENMPESELINSVILEPGSTFKCSAEYDILLNTVQYMKDHLFKEAKSIKLLDIFAADKSQVIVWIYKELKNQQKKNKEMKMELEKLKENHKLKASKIEELQDEIRKLKRSQTDTSNKYKKAIEQLKESQSKNKRFEQVSRSLNKKYEETVQMNTSELLSWTQV